MRAHPVIVSLVAEDDHALCVERDDGRHHRVRRVALHAERRAALVDDGKC